MLPLSTTLPTKHKQGMLVHKSNLKLLYDHIVSLVLRTDQSLGQLILLCFAAYINKFSHFLWHLSSGSLTTKDIVDMLQFPNK